MKCLVQELIAKTGTWSVDVQNEATGDVFQDRGEFLINASGFLKCVPTPHACDD